MTMQTNDDLPLAAASGVRDYRVYYEDRELRFRGTFLGSASTENRGSDRWIEFAVYRTEGSGKYILSRVGRSTRFHLKSCPTVAKNPQLRPVPVAALDQLASPCYGCLPDGDHHLSDNAAVYPERDRPWAGVYTTPQNLIDGLSKVNEQGINFLTHVARQVLEDAAENDQDLEDAYYVVKID